MLKARALAATALLLLACAGSARALLIEQPGENPLPGTTWPVDVPRRVKGYWLNGNTFQYYVGSAKAFNNFLHARAATATVMLILHPGPGDKGMAGAMDPSVRYDWEIATIHRWHTDEFGDGAKYGLAVNLYLGGRIGLEDLDVPLNVTVRSSSKIERFVASHEAKQSLVTKKPAEPTPPAAAPSTKTE